MPMDLPSLLSDTLTAQGFEVEDAPPLTGRSGATYPVSLLAEQRSERHLVDVLASRPVTGSDLDALDTVVEDTGLDGALLFALEGLAEDVETSDRVEVFDRDDVEQAIGSILLDRLLKHDEVETEPTPVPDLDAMGPTGANGGDPSKTPQTPDPAEDEPEPGPEVQQPPEAAQAEAPEDAEPEPEEAFVSPEEMAKRAKRMLEEGSIPDDGDAELIVDDDASPAQEPSPEVEAGTGSDEGVEPAFDPPAMDPDPQTAAPTEQEAPEPPEEGQVFEDGDCELLPSTPSTESQESQPDPADPPQPPQPSTEAPTSSEDPASVPPPESPVKAAGVEDAEEEAFLSGACIEPEIDAETARQEAKAALFDVDKARLELLPFHVFDYACVLEGGGRTRGEEGRVWVSAQSGAVVSAPDGPLVEDPGIPHERFQGRLGAVKASGQARDGLLESLETREEHREDHSETAVIERVTLEPDPDTLDLSHLGTAFAPRWRVEGQNGTVFVDAITGELIAE